MRALAQRRSPAAPSRRAFLRTLGVGSAAVLLPGGLASWLSAAESTRRGGFREPFPGPIKLTYFVDGVMRSADAEPNAVLSDVLRDMLQLAATPPRCERGDCGACAVAVNGHCVFACRSPAVLHEGAEITTHENAPQLAAAKPDRRPPGKHPLGDLAAR